MDILMNRCATFDTNKIFDREIIHAAREINAKQTASIISNVKFVSWINHSHNELITRIMREIEMDRHELAELTRELS